MLQVVLVAPVLANDAALRAGRAVEAVFDVVEPELGLTDKGHDPEAVTERAVWVKLLFFRLNSNGGPHPALWRIHARFSAVDLVLETQF